jgi:hypothetical protein
MLTENSPMPLGKYKGKPMKDIPVLYFNALYKKVGRAYSRDMRDVIVYINDNILEP